MSNVVSSAQALARKDRASSTLDQVAFFGAFILGAGAVLGLKYLHMSQVIVTAVPVALMFVYLGYVLWTRHFALGDDRIGDNLYYLGFLFTLVSIAASLYEFTTRDDAANRIIVNFGIALATTIVGVALRVTLMQVRGDPAEVERIARMELSEAAQRLRSEVDNATQSMASIRIANKQAIEETSQRMRSEVDETLKAMAELRASNKEAIEELTTSLVQAASAEMQKCSQAFRSMCNQINAEMKAQFDVFTQNATSFNRASSRLVSASEKLCQRLEAIDVPSNFLDKKFEGVSNKLDTSALALQNLATGLGESTGQMSVATVALRQSYDTLTVSAQELKQASSELLGQNNTIGELTKRWADLDRLISSQHALLQSAASLGDEVELVRRQREELRKQVEQGTQMLVDLESNLVSLARGLVERVNA